MQLKMSKRSLYNYHMQIDNALHKVVFRGKTDKINSLLNQIRPYKTTSEAETPLHLSLSKGHQNAANIFLNILEIDLTAARPFLNEHKINVGVDYFSSNHRSIYLHAKVENLIYRFLHPFRRANLSKSKSPLKVAKRKWVVSLNYNATN